MRKAGEMDVSKDQRGDLPSLGEVCFYICLLALFVFAVTYVWILITKELPSILAALWLFFGLIGLVGSVGSILWSGAGMSRGHTVRGLLTLVAGAAVPVWFYIGIGSIGGP
jgi:hypothetical protein